MISAKQVSLLTITGLVFVVVAVVIVIVLSQFHSTTLRLGNSIFHAQLAKDEASREKGLGGTRSLESGNAMILAFSSDNTWQIWMKGMNYPLDIVWLDKDKKVIDIVKDAPFENGELSEFTPAASARYVVELPAGTVVRDGISVGTQAYFDLNVDSIR
jgi:uncharacterized membrane protein (UPF0127 family)